MGQVGMEYIGQAVLTLLALTVRPCSGLRFAHHETHMEGPRRELGTPAVGGERLTACATRPPNSRN